MHWFFEQYDKTCEATPVIVHPSRTFASNVSPDPKTRIIDQDKLKLLRKALQDFAIAVAARAGDEKYIRERLSYFNFTSSTFVATFTREFKKVKKTAR